MAETSTNPQELIQAYKEGTPLEYEGPDSFQNSSIPEHDRSASCDAWEQYDNSLLSRHQSERGQQQDNTYGMDRENDVPVSWVGQGSESAFNGQLRSTSEPNHDERNMDFLERDNETSRPTESENYTGEDHQPLLHDLHHLQQSPPTATAYSYSNSLGSQDDARNPFSMIETSTYTFSEREAFLMRNFIENMALWADVADVERHFEIEVPRRALQHSVLRLAIFSFSSRHVSRFSEYEETEALEYHTQCLQLLIPALSAHDLTITEDVLAAIAILRQYEEMDAYDKRCHLIGTTKIVNSISTFGCSGGLGEAAAWLCLREDIYVSLVSQQPLRTRLENYHDSKTFQKDDDVSWANRMVFLLAKVLSHAFRSPDSPNQADTATAATSWRQMDEEVEYWKRAAPATFRPILFKPRSREQGRGLPEMWMLAPFHVVGLQYYHIARIVLAVSNHQSPTPGYENLWNARKIEKTVRNRLLIILGLAASNKTAANTLFTARHALSVWGGVLRDTLEQDAIVAFLADMERTTGWKTAPLIRSLKEQWDEDGE